MITLKMELNLKFMEIAYLEAKKAEKLNEVPIGCVIVKDNKIIAKAHNLCCKKKNPLAHCEILAIEKACKKLNSEKLFDCDIYVTLEPCIMCAMAISLSCIKNVYYGASNPKEGGVENGAMIYKNKYCCHKPNVISGIMKDECAEILSNFFKKKRKLIHNL